ncbi:basal body component [Angomonas deanei]|uniref:Uncharacterized protein n=1 Tax=Angomonas deanei TaxID=59799 RepID=A0A7G2CK23_9TRYP|nr:basal body component [Angomonas deanei]CAD2219725.1 hypothetical protein, conserved [Angomonas deanei]|eukprot:EPY29121.1 basal body component [Angomonas deanei]
MRNLREVNEARHKRLLEDVQSNAKALEKLVTTTQNELEKALEEKRALERKLRETERKLNVLLDEKKDLEENEGGFATQLQSSKAEVSALRERCANLESLKNIAEANFQESQRRESELLAKIDELRSAQQLMQLCFDKQQEQLEIGRRMREYNPNRISSK